MNRATNETTATQSSLALTAKRDEIAFLISDLCDQLLEYDPELKICNGGTVGFKAADQIVARYLGTAAISDAGWHPIETAPHDEIIVLGWYQIPSFGQPPVWMAEVGCASWGERNEVASSQSRHGSATHWLTLPPPPAQAGPEPVCEEPDDIERCFVCLVPFKSGDRVLSDVNEGAMHAACCGPERECYVGADGEPLKPGEPIPEGYVWEPWPKASAAVAPVGEGDAVEALRASSAEATPGKWKACPSVEGDFFAVYPDTDRMEFPIAKAPTYFKKDVWRKNAKFIADAVNFVRTHVLTVKAEEEPERDNCQFCLGAKGGARGNENRFAGSIVVCDYCTLPAQKIYDEGARAALASIPAVAGGTGWHPDDVSPPEALYAWLLRHYEETDPTKGDAFRPVARKLVAALGEFIAAERPAAPTQTAREGVEASALEQAFGLLWGVTTDDQRVHESRKILRSLLAGEGFYRGIKWATEHVGPPESGYAAVRRGL